MASRLLLVDNDRSFLKEHQVSLEAAFDIDVLSTPDSAIPKLEAGGYAAVLICVEVADNKGYALCSAVRKSPKLADMKVALISAKATEEEYKRHQSLKGKADLYLHKPMAPTALVEALGTLVPPKAVDPDNPLGDLSDLGAGDDWLDSLKTDLSEDLAAPAPAVPTTMPAAAPVPAPAKTMAISADMLRELTGGAPMAPPAARNPTATGPLQIPPTLPVSAGPDPRVKELEARLAEAEGRFSEAKAQASALEAHLKDMEKAVADRDSAIADRDKALAERDGLIQERDRHIQDRDAKLVDREAALARAQADFESLKSTHDSVTRNLDELEKRQADAAVLQGKLEAAEAAVRQFEEHAAKENPEGLKAQLREAMTERQELLQQVETLNAQLGEKTQRVVDLIKDRDKHQQAAMNLEAKADELESLKGAHAAAGKDLGEARERIAALEKSKGDLEAVKTELLKGKEDLQKALDDAKAEHARVLDETKSGHGKVLQDLKTEQSKALEAAKSSADAAEERAKTLKGEVAGLEATMKGQGRDLVEMGGRLADKEKEVEALRQTAATKEADLAEATGRIKALEDDLHALRNQHQALQATQSGLEKEKDALASRLAAHGDHVSAIHGLMDDLEGLLARRKTLPKP